MQAARSLTLLAMLVVSAAHAQAADPVEGTDYQPIRPAVATSDAARIVVTQFFSYQCPHCYKFEKSFTTWTGSLPQDVKVERAAVAIGHPTWVATAQAYYALGAMKKVPAIDEAFFSAVHRERKKLTDEASIAAWVAEQGIDRAEFEKTYRSFSVQLQTKRADEQSRKVRLPSVPTIVVDGRYLVPIKDDGDFRDQLSILDTLIERARRERGGAMPASP
jgi:thiol:disulfide interchange protein DsbA